MSALDTTLRPSAEVAAAAAPATSQVVAVDAGERNRYWREFEETFQSGWLCLDHVSGVLQSESSFKILVKMLQAWLDDLITPIMKNDVDAEYADKFRNDLVSVNAVLDGILFLSMAEEEDHRVFKPVLIKAQQILDGLREQLVFENVQGFLMPTKTEEEEASEPELFLNTYTADAVEQVLHEIAKAAEAAGRYVDQAALAGKVDLAVLRSMLKQIGSLADDVGAPHVMGYPTNWAIDLTNWKAGAA